MNTHKYYNNSANEYLKFRSAVKWILDPLFDLVKSSNADGTILEIGCGTGNYIIEVSEFLTNRQCIGIDISNEMLKKAIKRKADISFLEADVCGHIPIVSNSISIVFCVDVIHHIKDLRKAFRDIFRILNDNGKLIIVTDSTDDLNNRSITTFFPESLSFELSRYHSIDSISMSAYSEGFKSITPKSIGITRNITDETFKILEQKAFSALSILTDSQHKIGLERAKQAIKLGEKWNSCSTIFEIKKK
jgi:ubiquinone/menaquinone biosynthesis C-methylase UbiE